MIALIATVVCIAWILWLYFLDREPGVRTAKALWIPTAWLLINASRPVSAWMQRTSVESLAQQYTEGSPLDAAVFGILILAAVVVLNFRPRQTANLLRHNLPLLLFFGFAAISILWSDFSFIALKRWSKAIGDLIMIVVVLTDGQPVAAVKRFFARTAFVLLPLSVLLIMFYPGLGSAYFPDDRMVEYFGVTTNKNMLGMTALVLGLASLWSFLCAYGDRGMPHRSRHLLAHGMMVGTAMCLILRANSVTSLSCFGLAGAVMVMLSQRSVIRWRNGPHVIVGAAVAFPIFAVFIDTMGSLLHVLGRNSTLTDRTLIWKAVLSLHTNPFIGTGFESFWLGGRLASVWSLSVHGIQEAHNGYIEVYLNLGWIGLLMLGAALIAGYRDSLAAYRSNPQVGRLRLAFLTAAVVYSLSEAGFRMMSPIWIAALLMIAVSPLGFQPQEQPQWAALPQARDVRRGQARVLQ